MKSFAIYAITLFALIFLVLPATAQNRAGEGLRIDSTDPPHRPSIRSMDSSSGPGGSSAASSTAAGAPASSASAMDSGWVTGSYVGGASYAGVGPNLTGTSFVSPYLYYDWMNYYSYLSRTYHVNPFYFTRFYRHSEPLVTPQILKLTLQDPMRQSSEMLAAIDELEKMVLEIHSGKVIDKAALLNTSRAIRESAKKIRKNQTLSLIDLRKSEDLCNVKGGFPTLETLGKMREWAVDIDRQLRVLYHQRTTATISVEDYRQPSLESLAKGIEKICKSIENSAKRM